MADPQILDLTRRLVLSAANPYYCEGKVASGPGGPHAGTGFMHEAFNKDDPNTLTRYWFAWANTIFGELVLKTFNQNPALLC